MWTRKGGLIIFLGIISLLLGMILADFQFMILAIIIFTFFLLVITLPKPAIELDRTVLNPLLFENNNLRVNLRIKKVRDGYGTIEVFDRITHYSKLTEGINNMVYNPTGLERLGYSLNFPLRGYYSVGPTKVRISDHFNYFYTDQELKEKQLISVFPRTPGLKDFKMKSKRYIHFPGDFLTRQPGTSTEFYNIRDYIKGDPFKKINWKVYARKRELMVNEYEKENICDTVIFLDARSFSNIGSIQDNALETGIKLTLGIVNYLLLHRNQLGLVVYNDQVRVLPPKYGISQRNEIIRFLTGIYARGWAGFNIALFHARPFIKSKTTVIIISNLEYDNSFLAAVQELAAFNHKIMIISPASMAYEIAASDYTGPTERLELNKLHRENFILHLRGMGIDVIECTPEDSIDEVVTRISREIVR
ncbi:DUF58 domain-containing protein [[Eubacterium] cellulosolvens]